MKKVKTVLILCLLAATLSGCKSKDKIDISNIHTTAAPTTAPKETFPETTAASTKAETKSPVVADSDLETKIETYSNNNISIQYPVLSNLTDTNLQDQINSLLKENARSIIGAWELDETKDSLSIEAKVETLNRRRIAVTYQGILTADGSAHPVNIFYTNSIDLNSGSSVGLSKYADAYTIAGYIASGDYKLVGVTPEQEAAIRETLVSDVQNIDYYYALLQKADFSGDKAFSGTSFPESFSYESQGVVYVSLPVPYALGDYVIIKYVADNK